MKDFYRTAAGRRFFETDLPDLIKALQNISLNLEKSNEREEKRRRVEEKVQKLQIREANAKEK